MRTDQLQRYAAATDLAIARKIQAPLLGNGRASYTRLMSVSRLGIVAAAAGVLIKDELARNPTLLGLDRSALQAAANDLGAAYEVADVTQSEMLAAAIAHLGPFDILVNNAGAASSQSFMKSTPQDWAAMIAVPLSADAGSMILTTPRLGEINSSLMTGTSASRPEAPVRSATFRPTTT